MAKVFIYTVDDLRRLYSLKFDITNIPASDLDLDVCSRIWGICELLDVKNEKPTTVVPEFHKYILRFLKNFLIWLACKGELEFSEKFGDQFQARIYRLYYSRNKELYKDLEKKEEKDDPTLTDKDWFEILFSKEFK